jgi:O-antigen/teichoic acid export membrane protein
MVLTSIGPETPPPHSSRRRLLNNLIVLSGGQVVTWGLAIVWAIFVPARLGAAGMGVFGVATAVGGLLIAIFGMGVATMITKEVAGDHRRAPRLIGASMYLRLISIPLCFATVVVYTRLINADRQTGTMIWLLTGATTLQLLSGPLFAVAQGLEHMKYQTSSDVVIKAGLTLGGVALVMAGFGVISIGVATLVATASGTLLVVIWGRRHFTIDWTFDWGEIRHLSFGSAPYWTTGLVLTFYLWIDLLILERLAPIEVVGYYTVPTRLFGTMVVVPGILTVALFPRLSRAFKEGARHLAAEIKPVMELSLAVTLPIAVGTALVASEVLRVLYGFTFLPAAPVLAILGLCLPATVLNMFANQVLVASDRQLVWTKVMVVAAVLNPVLNLVLVRWTQAHWHNGAIGAALALLATETLVAGAALVLMPKVLDRSSAGRLIRAAATSAGMGLTIWGVSRAGGLLFQIPAAMVVFATLAVLFRVVSRDELHGLRTIASRLARKSPNAV